MHVYIIETKQQFSLCVCFLMKHIFARLLWPWLKWSQCCRKCSSDSVCAKKKKKNKKKTVASNGISWNWRTSNKFRKITVSRIDTVQLVEFLCNTFSNANFCLLPLFFVSLFHFYFFIFTANIILTFHSFVLHWMANFDKIADKMC